ncbi:phytanoyl-CoA dioxygenase family protein [bacterium]|nr:phytanoyl-CoA dioxygenase family protein [bacterium]
MNKSNLRKQVVGILKRLGIAGVLKSAIDVLNLIRGGLNYSLSGRTPEYAYHSMVRLFCVTQGMSNDFMSWLVSLKRRPYSLPKSNGILGSMTPDKTQSVLEDLEKKGYHVFAEKLPEDLCTALLNYGYQMESMVRPLSGQKGAAPIVKTTYQAQSPIGVRYDFSPTALLSTPEVQKIISDYSLLAVAQAYLKAQPVLDIVTMWWHTAFQKTPDKDAAQYFHFDMDRLRWVKFFFYITDVAPTNGPHCFVAKSHRSKGIPKKLLEKGYSRLDDEEVFAHYSQEDLVEFSAPRGTIIAEDTRGLHKGKHVETGDRLVFQLQFCNSLFGAPLQSGRLENLRCADLENRIRENPGIYKLYS